MHAYITIDRASPDSIDPFYSNRGHDRTISSPKLTSREAVDAYLAEHAPEVIGSNPHWVNWPTTPDPRAFFFLTGRDPRGYYAEVYIREYHQPE